MIKIILIKSPARTLLVSTLVAFQVFFSIITYAQYKKPLEDVTTNMHSQYLQLKDSFGINKHMPAEFEKQIVYALSYFPELRYTPIRFVLLKGNSGIISTRPTWGSVFCRSSKRSYVVFIGDSSQGTSPKFLFRNSGVNGQVGILGHELTHILNFSRLNSFGLLGIGVGHVSRKYMDNFENKTDSVCIERGLGYQLIDWNIYLRTAFGMTDPENGPDPFFTYAKRERYMSPASIRRVMSKSAAYKTTR